MNNWIDLINYAIAIAGLVVSILGFILVLISPYLQTWNKWFYRIFFSFLTLYMISDLISQLSLALWGPDGTIITKLAIFLESLFSSLLMPMLTIHILEISGNTWTKNPILYLSFVLWNIYLILLIVTQFTTIIYYVSPDNTYHRGSWYPILLVPLVLFIILNILIWIYYFQSFSIRQRIAFAIYLFVPLICMIIQMFSYGLLLTVIGTAFAAILMFLLFLRDQVEKLITQKEINTRQQASIMVLEMRPHFIYNTMMSIYYLCEQDVEKAQQVILNFNTYLRKNFTAIVKENTIPFLEELEHTKAYLAVEQVRFEGQLYVEFDIECMNFRTPPLTLQPIVENAIKHGLDPDLDPLRILIRTREFDDYYQIIVEDNGPGIQKPWNNQISGQQTDQNDQTSPNDSEPHIALNNIHERLALMCHGTMTIAQHDKGGTIVTIQIPSQNSNS